MSENNTSIDFIAYLTLYIRIDFDDDDAMFCKYNADFSKPIDESFMRKMLDTSREFGEMQPGKTVKDVRYVTKEEYERGTEDRQPDFVWTQSNDAVEKTGGGQK